MNCLTTESFNALFPGKYMQMMSILKPIAFDVTICMSQLLDYYLYTVSEQSDLESTQKYSAPNIY